MHVEKSQRNSGMNKQDGLVESPTAVLDLSTNIEYCVS